MPDGHLTEEDVKDVPAVDIITRNIGGREYKHARPCCVSGHTMAGGTFLYSCDSRFRSINDYPIALHDRVEA